MDKSNIMKVKITKIGSMEGGEVSKFATIGDSFTGEAKGLPTVGERYNVYGETRLEISTSVVTRGLYFLDTDLVFDTTYSIYKFEDL